MKIFLKKNKGLILKTFLIIGIFVRLWLFIGSNWYIDLDSYFDSRLEINSAISILSGNWMGNYSKFILCKNPSYPLFLALLYILHLPYPIGLGIFVLFASFSFVKALEPLCKSKTLKIFIFLLILYNPVGFSHEAVYPYRNALVPWAILLVMSSIIAIYIRKDENYKKIIPWSFAGMISMGFFWLLREDSIWFLPFAVGAFILTCLHWLLKKEKIKKLLLSSLLAALPLCGIVVASVSISTINYYYYGIFTTNDRTKTYEAKVLGLLAKIDDGTDLNKDVWVSSDAIKLAKNASKTFATLELQPFDNWPKYGDYSIWALRDCLDDSGYYKDAKKTNQIYKKIAQELEQGFKVGKLKKKKSIQLSSTSGTYTIKEMLQVLPLGFESIKNHVTYKYAYVDLEKVVNDNNEGVLLYEQVLGIDLLRTENLNKEETDEFLKSISKKKLSSLYINRTISRFIIGCYKYTGWVFFSIGCFGYIILLIKWFKEKKRWSKSIEIFIIMTGILLLCYVNAYLVGLWGIGFNLTANDSLFEAYTTAQYLILQIFELLGCISLINYIKAKKSKEKDK